MSRKQPETATDLLDSSMRLARCVLTECERNRMPFPANVWLFAILAKLIASARSARMLILSRQRWDAKLIIRSMYDSLIDVLYILHGPGTTREVLELLQIEMAIDQFERLEYAAKRCGKSVDDLPHDKVTDEIRRTYARARRQPAFSAKRGEWPRRWRNISSGEKLSAIRKGDCRKWLDLLDFSVKRMGDAAAHARGLALETFVVKTGDGKLRFTTKPRLHFDLGEETLLVMEPFVCVLGVSAAIVDAFALGEPFESRARRLHSRWKKMVRHSAGRGRKRG